MAGMLFKDSRTALAFERAAGADEVTVLLAVDVERPDRVCDLVTRLRGSVVRRHDAIGYVRAVVPIEHVDELVADDAVDTASVMLTHDFTPSAPAAWVPGANGTGAARTVTSTAAPPAGEVARLPLLPDPIATPYSPLADLAAEEFRAQHPTWDGRGVTVAIIDGFIDQLLPEFQSATALDGSPVPKILDCVNPLDPHLDGGPEWITEWDQVTAVDGKFTAHGQTLRAPHDGTFHLGFLDESRLSFGGGDLTRDGNPEGSSPLYAVLWDRDANLVWVDTDQDLDFANERPMTDYKVRQDIGIFGDPESTTPVRESVMFTVQTSPEHDAVGINIGGGGHATVIAGATFGSRGDSGRYDGIAPGARIVSVNPWRGDSRSTAGTAIEALIAAFTDPRVDLIVSEWANFTAFAYLTKDGRSITSVLAQRLVDLHGKPLFVPASNVPLLNQPLEDSVGSAVIGVGGYQSQKCYRINNGLLVPEQDNLHLGSSHGPAGDGAMAPLLLAPSSLLSSKLGFDDDHHGPHRLPGGYGIATGTSTAAPAAAAAAALLISAAKQSGISYDSTRLRRALCASARLLPRIPSHQQGHGLIQVDAAWQALCDLHHRESGTAETTITTAAPVHTTVSGWLNPPDQGRGLYEREGWAVGDRRTCTITLTRTGGPAEPMPYRVAWLGNDGTFSCAESITLPLGEPVELRVEIAPTSPGVHSATLLLTDPSAVWEEHRILATVVVPAHDLDEGHSVEAGVGVRAGLPGATYFRVPAGTKALQIEADSATTLHATPPHGGWLLVGENPDNWTRGGRTRKTWSYPPPGVWEAAFIGKSALNSAERHRVTEATPRAGRLTATLFEVDVDPYPPDLFDPAPGSHVDLRIELTNRRARFTGGVPSRSLGAARALTTTIAEHEMHVHVLEVAAGSELLLASAQATDADADLDVYLFDCTGTGPRLVKKHTSLASGGVLAVEDPTPGTWKVVVDAPRAPRGSTTYEYLDFVTNPRYGSLSTAEVPREHDPDEKWDLTAHVWFAAAPEDDRAPAALILVTSDDIRQQVAQTQWDPKLFGDAVKPDPRVEHVPLGWAAVLFEAAGPRVVTG